MPSLGDVVSLPEPIELDDESNLAVAQGLDSLDLLEIQSEIERLTGHYLEWDEQDDAAVFSVSALADALMRSIAASGSSLGSRGLAARLLRKQEALEGGWLGFPLTAQQSAAGLDWGLVRRLKSSTG